MEKGMTSLRVYPLLFIVSLFLLISFGKDHIKAAPLKNNEREVFIYKLKWLGITAGRARMEFIDRGEEIKITTRAESADWVSIFYKVDDRAKSLLTKRRNRDGGYKFIAKRYRLKIREGRHRRDKEVIFYPDKGMAEYINHLEDEKKSFEIPGGTYDPLSAFLMLRLKSIKIGEPVFLRIFDSKKVWDVKVDVLKKETVETEAGKFSTIVVKPELKSEGIFLKKGDIYIYLTDDERHIPVLIETKVLIGHIEAELVGGEF